MRCASRLEASMPRGLPLMLPPCAKALLCPPVILYLIVTSVLGFAEYEPCTLRVLKGGDPPSPSFPPTTTATPLPGMSAALATAPRHPSLAHRRASPCQLLGCYAYILTLSEVAALGHMDREDCFCFCVILRFCTLALWRRLSTTLRHWRRLLGAGFAARCS